MLTGSDLWLIIASTAVCTTVVTALTWLVLRLNRRGSIASQVTIVVLGAIVSIACSTQVILIEMYFSSHDILVMAWILGVSAALSLTAAWFVTARTARKSIAQLTTSAQRIGDGAVVPASRPGWREFDQLSGELAETSERLARARAEIDKLDTARREFFAWISHDLRTPLTGIAALSEALEGNLAADPVDYVRQIRTKVDTVNSMVDDLFELSKLQSGTLRLHPEVVELLDLVSDAVSDVRPMAAERGIRVTQSGIDGHTLWADPRELTRAIGNLLTNSIRHAPRDTEILVSAENLPDDRLILSVLDHGPGVAVEDLGRIFDVGWRADAARTAESGTTTTGAGLGLAIVRGIIEAHGGTVNAHHLDDGFQLQLIIPAPAPTAGQEGGADTGPASPRSH